LNSFRLCQVSSLHFKPKTVSSNTVSTVTTTDNVNTLANTDATAVVKNTVNTAQNIKHNKETAYISTGFRNWKKAPECFSHEDSNCHRASFSL